MEQILIEAAKQAPALVVLAWIVYTFLKYLKEYAEGQAVSLGNLGDTCHAFQREMHESNATILTSVRTTLDKTNEVLGRAANTIDRGERICTQVEAMRGKQ